MIPTGTPKQQVPPKHRAFDRGQSLVTDTRDYNLSVCPGQHCLGRQQRVSSHRHTDFAIHFLNAEQSAAADRMWTR